MINPSKILKLKQEKDQFAARHSEFVAFLGNVLKSEIEDGSTIAVVFSAKNGDEHGCELNITEEDVHALKTIGKVL